MKSLLILAVLSLLAITLPLTIASDPSPLQDFCVSTNNSLNGVFVNGKFCKDPKLVTANDFFFGGLQNPRPITNRVGSVETPVTVNEVPGLNTFGVSTGRIDFAVDGLNPPHTHPRATEIFFVNQGTILVGFVTSNPDNRLFTKILTVGDLFVFPMGLIHFQMNIGKYPAVALNALSSQNPGTITIANALFGSNPQINQNVLAKAFQLDPKIIMNLLTKFKQNA